MAALHSRAVSTVSTVSQGHVCPKSPVLTAGTHVTRHSHCDVYSHRPVAPPLGEQRSPGRQCPGRHTHPLAPPPPHAGHPATKQSRLSAAVGIRLCSVCDTLWKRWHRGVIPPSQSFLAQPVAADHLTPAKSSGTQGMVGGLRLCHKCHTKIHAAVAPPHASTQRHQPAGEERWDGDGGPGQCHLCHKGHKGGVRSGPVLTLVTQVTLCSLHCPTPRVRLSHQRLKLPL